jgi:hypothetical protein
VFTPLPDVIVISIQTPKASGLAIQCQAPGSAGCSRVSSHPNYCIGPRGWMGHPYRTQCHPTACCGGCNRGSLSWRPWRHGARFRRTFTLEDAIEFHAFAPLEASKRVTNGISLGCYNKCRVFTPLTGWHCKLRPTAEGCCTPTLDCTKANRSDICNSNIVHRFCLHRFWRPIQTCLPCRK